MSSNRTYTTGSNLNQTPNITAILSQTEDQGFDCNEYNLQIMSHDISIRRKPFKAKRREGEMFQMSTDLYRRFSRRGQSQKIQSKANKEFNFTHHR